MVQQSTPDWAKILTHKYFPSASSSDVPRLALMGKGSCVWNTLKKGAQLIKEGRFWICNGGLDALFGRTLGMAIRQ